MPSFQSENAWNCLCRSARPCNTLIKYEWLTGSTPLKMAQLEDAAVGEVLRLIKEVEPPKPSTRISASQPNVAIQRRVEPGHLARSVSGDLDWVVMKALEKERSRRYETANGLAADLERHLNDEPVYDASTYHGLVELKAGTGGVNAITFSHDNQRVVSVSEEGTLDVWEVPTGRLLRTAGKPGDSAINCAVHSPDGSLLVTGSADGTLAVWDPLDLRKVYQTQAHGAAVLALAFTPDGSRLMTSSADRSLKVFDPSAWRELLAQYLEGPARSMSFSPDGKRLALATGAVGSRRLGLAADAVSILETEPEVERFELRRLEREHEEAAQSLLQNVLDETTDSVQVRQRIVEQTAVDPPLRSSALHQWRQWLGERVFDAYGTWSSDWLNLEILRQRLVFRSNEDPTDHQRRRLIDAINSSVYLDAIHRQALLGLVAATVSERYQGPSSAESGLDSRKLAWEVISNPDRDPQDHLVAYLGMGPVVQQRPEDAACLVTMGWAEYRVGLYADAIETAENIVESSHDAQGLHVKRLAVLAMSQHRMGQTEAAISTMQQLELIIGQPGESTDQTAIAVADEARKVLADPLDAPWNEQAAWDSLKSRLEQTLGESNCLICLAHSAVRRRRRSTGKGDEEAATEARKTALTLLEKALAIDPKNTATANELAALLLTDTTNWTVLEPTEMKSAGGATLTRLADGSILASGKNSLGDAYTIVAEADAMRVAAIRLEAVTHESLPNRGPGRAAERDPGNFSMRNWEITSLAPGSEDIPIRLQQAVANPPVSFSRNRDALEYQRSQIAADHRVVSPANPR